MTRPQRIAAAVLALLVCFGAARLYTTGQANHRLAHDLEVNQIEEHARIDAIVNALATLQTSVDQGQPVTAAQIRQVIDTALTGKGFTGPAGPRGPQGPQGTPGPTVTTTTVKPTTTTRQTTTTRCLVKVRKVCVP